MSSDLRMLGCTGWKILSPLEGCPAIGCLLAEPLISLLANKDCCQITGFKFFKFRKMLFNIINKRWMLAITSILLFLVFVFLLLTLFQKVTCYF